MPLFISWLKEEHVSKWFSSPEEWLDEVKRRNDKFIWIKHFIILADKTPIDFCQYYPFEKSGEAYNRNIPKEGTYSIDYLIGNINYLNKGIGSNAIKLLNSKIFSLSGAKRIIVQPESDNIASQKTLLSAGYNTYNKENNLFILD